MAEIDLAKLDLVCCWKLECLPAEVVFRRQCLLLDCGCLAVLGDLPKNYELEAWGLYELS